MPRDVLFKLDLRKKFIFSGLKTVGDMSSCFPHLCEHEKYPDSICDENRGFDELINLDTCYLW